VLLGIADGSEEVVELRPLRTGESLHHARYLSALKHHGLCLVVDVDDGLTPPRIAREHLGGCSLRRLLAKLKEAQRALDDLVAGAIGAELLDALDFLHRQPDPLTRAPLGLGHGALSTSSVLITWDGEVKLRDFGLRRPAKGQDLQGAAKVLAPLFGHVPHAVSRAVADGGAFESCGVFGDALRQAEGLGQSQRSGGGKKALRELMHKLFPGAAAGDEERRRALLARRHKSDEAPKRTTVSSRREPTSGKHRQDKAKAAQRTLVDEQPVAEPRRHVRLAAMGAGGVLGAVLFGVWVYYIVLWFQDAGMLPTTSGQRVLEDGPTAPGGMIRASRGARRGKHVRPRGLRPGPAGESSMGTRAGKASGEARGVLEGCSQPCAGAVLKAVMSGGRIEDRDDQRELTSAQFENCLALCRDEGAR
jgi:hypothetical protein